MKPLNTLETDQRMLWFPTLFNIIFFKLALIQKPQADEFIHWDSCLNSETTEENKLHPLQSNKNRSLENIETTLSSFTNNNVHVLSTTLNSLFLLENIWNNTSNNIAATYINSEEYTVSSCFL